MRIPLGTTLLTVAVFPPATALAYSGPGLGRTLVQGIIAAIAAACVILKDRPRIGSPPACPERGADLKGNVEPPQA